MEYSWTGELGENNEVFKSYVRMMRYIEKKIAEGQKGTSLEDLDAEVSFCPILMPEERRQYYPARSRLDRKNRVFYCSPQLDYDVFLSGDLKGQLNNCIEELLEAAEPLRKLGASEQQIQDYVEMLESMRR